MVFGSADFDDHERVIFIRDADSGLKAIIAIHSTALGPAAGGCRIYPYEDEAAALTDVLRLSKGMTFKNAMAGLPLGGGKTVVIADPQKDKTPAMLRALGRAIEQLGGLYTTGEDVGSSAEDMAEIRKETRHALGLPVSAGGSGDPSPSTALGCFEGICAAVRHKWGRDDLDGLRVAVQGLGHVGYRLAAMLAKAGAKLIVTDMREEAAARAVAEFGAEAVAPDAIYEAEADIFVPCALGAVINDETLPRLRAGIVAGAANNQLAAPAHGAALRERGILYAPDYVINAGGVIQLAGELTGETAEAVEVRVRAIGATLSAVFEAADTQDIPTSEAADRLAVQRILAAMARRA